MDIDEKRVERRAYWPVRVSSLRHQEPARMNGSVQSRIRAVATLTEDAWGLAGRSIPSYARHETPIRVVSYGRRVRFRALNEDFLDFLRALCARKARFLVVGEELGTDSAG